MDDQNHPAKTVWQPLTPPGVAQFAAGSLSQLLLAEAVVALCVAAVVIWLVAVRFSPAVTQALTQFPAAAKLESGWLLGVESGLLVDGKFLSIMIDLDGQTEIGTADWQVRLQPDGFSLGTSYQSDSHLSSVAFYYPPGTILLGRTVSEPWWGAWRPVIVVGLGVICAGGLLVSWQVLALIYQWWARLMAYFADRELSGQGSRRLAAAAQLPAALFMALAMVLYGLQAIDLVSFFIFYALHFVIGWIYVFVSPFFLPRLAGTGMSRTNPFALPPTKL